ncbi:MAG TPA: tRNA (adenosine(37)-N6)-threonylcarbamoyltransferase complex dimerization subunit type 1 TsaB [Pyrinomonadaceae bacterium]|nr:tRNA (adenosine(37)-N6)-threonylcarbamoyltransferase complex dimerization subunit type 1 TsaB [Pyrinomonadaceae bacterium]
MSNESNQSAPDAPVDNSATSARTRADAAETLVLSLDTATANRSVAVVRGERTLALVCGDLRESHSANVLADVDKALQQASVKIADVELFAAACGPGSFTGLRAGLATVKAFAATLQQPVVGVPTLHALAYAARPASRLWALIPAGRGEVFAQLLSVDSEGHIEELSEGIHVPPAALIEHEQLRCETVKWVGGGAHAAASLILEGARACACTFVEEAKEDSSEAAATGGAVWTLARPVENLAPAVAALALRTMEARTPMRAEDLQAIYIRASDAELNERWRAQQSPKEIHSKRPSTR